MSRSAVLALFVAGCCPPIKEPEVIRVPIPSSLTEPCVLEVEEPKTNGDLLLAYSEVLYLLGVCNARLESIGNLNGRSNQPAD